MHHPNYRSEDVSIFTRLQLSSQQTILSFSGRKNIEGGNLLRLAPPSYACGTADTTLTKYKTILYTNL
jgi:hypothetical protein